MKTPAKRQIQKLIRRYRWYHRMDLGYGLVTPGFGFNNLIPTAALLRHLPLENRKTLDIGTWDGKMAFAMENMGARVSACDLRTRPTIVSLIQMFASRVQYRPGFRDRDLEKLRRECGTFDFVLCAGLLYHVYSPLELILEVRKLTRIGGYALFESACVDNSKKLTMQFNRGDLYPDRTTLWVPSIGCLHYMIRYACFDIVAEATLHSQGTIPRHAVLAQAKRPSELKRRPILDQFLKNTFSEKTSKYLLPAWNRRQFESSKENRDLKKWKGLLRKKLVFYYHKPVGYQKESAFLMKATPLNRI